jgi:hypothetical protein
VNDRYASALRVDLNVEPNYEIEAWSETRWNGCWNPDQGVGLYTHMGRFRKELDLWWAQTVAYLPGGRLAVDRSWGRTPDRDRVTTGPFELRLLDTGWQSGFDGVCELTTPTALARAPRGSSAPSVPVKWEVSAEPVAPVWDLYAGLDERHEFAGDTHIQQGFRTSGTLTVAGAEYSLDGVGFKDHSSGVRRWDGYGSHHFVLAVMPGWTMHTIGMYAADGGARPPMGCVFENGGQFPMARTELATLNDAAGGPEMQELVVQHEGGELLNIQTELLASLPMTITEVNDNINGIDWEADGDPVVLIEGIAKLTEPDGTVGYGMYERGVRRNTLARP